MATRPAEKPSDVPAPRHRLDQALHDVVNAMSAARAFAEVVRTRASPQDAPLFDAMMAEMDRVAQIVRGVRQGAYDEYAPGDVLECMRCGHTFVNRKRAGRGAACRRCRSVEVSRWRPTR